MVDGGAERPARLARTVGAFLVLAITANALMGYASSQFVYLRSTVYLALWAHLFVSLYDGCFDRLRRATWLILIGTWFGLEVLSFVGNMLPLGQIGYAMTAWTGEKALAGPAIAFLADLVKRLTASTGPLSDPAACLLLAALAADFLTMHLRRHGENRPRIGRIAILVAAACLAAGALGTLTGLPPIDSPEAASSFAILPPWFALPYYAVLRSVPAKTIGLILVACLFLAPLAWPWLGIAGLRNGRMRLAFQLAMAAFGASWIALTVLGGSAPEDETILTSRLAAGYVLAFFFVIVPALSAVEARPKPAPTRSSQPAA